ncbi:MAG: trypsin-like peptidase domain-containing protein [Candidatus Sungbacteria bacterium]|uniref:Trypsin-like peptidase domain-containing protein n=1 Tax=Candidatus Sungiibacteriota bacterium TaxID=2750080 RepID=A0A931YDH4_9BACT|nr:trypsin-like peptidase domain-containing protein [Candidatus Sungbacteria bacterium]
MELEKFKFTILIMALALLAGFLGGYAANLAYLPDSSGLPAVSLEKPLAISKNSFAQEEAVVNIVKRYSPAVVSVIVSKDVPIIERCFINPFGDDPFFGQFFGGFQIPSQCQKGTERREVGGGTGFIVSSDGLIVTNKHVVAEAAAEYTVLTNDEKKYPAKVLARDPLKDLAILKIEAAALPVVVLGDSSNLQIGQTVIAIGNALGEFRNTISLGIVSGLARTIVASGGGQTEELRNIIQTDAAINPGNSGGPLLNLKGEVIGVNVAVAEGAQGIGFALPVNEAKKSIQSVKTQGRIVYPYIGIRFVTLNETISKENNLPAAEGAWLKPGGAEEPVIKDGPAAKAGLKAGDIITEINGKKLVSQDPLSDAIQKFNVGQIINLKIIRGGQTLTIPVTLEERKF